MAEEPQPSFIAPKLTKKTYESAQTLANEIANGLRIIFPPGFLSRKGEKGESGVKKRTIEASAASGSNRIIMGENVEKASVNLVCTDPSPAIGILCIQGEIVILTGSTPTSNYKAVATFSS